MKYKNFFDELAETEKMVAGYIDNQLKSTKKIQPQILEDCVLSYVKRGGKKLRPAVLMLSCLAVGGDKQKALAASAAVELFHTWTLVHDDVIDNDNLRRGVETVHKTAERYAANNFKLEKDTAAKYGIDLAILTGDVQHGWAISMLSNNLVQNGVKPEIALHLISLLQIGVLRDLVEGEILDVDFGLHYNIQDLSDEQILNMLWLKTGALYEFCGIAGSLIGKNVLSYDEEVVALKEFCSLAGVAFQVRDDILGLIGKEKELGKPVGSDIREGKKTLLVKEALNNANDAQKGMILNVLGNSKASESDIKHVTDLIVDLGGVEKAHKIAHDYIAKALPRLEILKPSKSRDLLFDWANFLIDRDY
ncbi:MAG: polyprenyl synthetase family protein [Dysgonamonadaceae bacterium]|jgi:geranylgeranyl diphosphate synthase type I|nr:polyprenyl synthetase family protein [Dysgonamonadaceae bacterium]